jgi:hypothetical protein
MSLLPLATQTLAWLKHAADNGQCESLALLHLIARADARDQDVAEFLGHYSRFLGSYSKTIAALCRRMEALEREANDLPAPAAPVDAAPVALAAAPAGGLVKKVASAMGPSTQAAMDAGELPFGTASTAICEVAAWLDTRGQHCCSALLREEIK